MGTQLRGRLLWVGAVVALCWTGVAPAEEKDVPNRVNELIAVLAGPDARGANLRAAVAAQEELVSLGGPAAPQLVAAVLTQSPTSNVGYTAGQILLDIGKPGLPAIRAKWPDMNDERRWRLMPVMEKHDPASVRDYAYNCIDSEGSVRLVAWQYLLRAKDLRAKDRYFDALIIEGREAPYLRFGLLPIYGPVYDDKREVDILIELLKPNSWVAKGEENFPVSCRPPTWWPDNRPIIVRGLHRQKVNRAAPALLAVLREKGPGVAYLAESIIPALADLGDKDAIPELELIVASKPKPGEREDLHLYVHSGYKRVRQLAADAIKRINEVKR